MSAQKLALSASVNSYQRAERKAIMTLSDHGNINLQNKISDAIDANLHRISELKSLIGAMETQNTELAHDNDDFRNGAMDAV
jgi:predicted nucleotide-binding protein